MSHTFKNHFGIPTKQNVDFMDIPLNEDLEAFICPFLIANNRDNKILNAAYLCMQGFLTNLNRNFVQTNDRLGGLALLSNLHEPNEYHLGYSSESQGKAISRSKSEIIFDALRDNRLARAGSSITNEAHHVLLLVKGIGQDNMSDIIANVCRHIFAQFTAEQCIKHSIPTKPFELAHYDPVTGNWTMKVFELPVYFEKPIILLPKKSACGSRAYANLYNWFVAKNYISEEILKKSIHASHKAVKQLKDGSRRAITKVIYQMYAKPKGELVEYVLRYTGSLLAFQLYAKENFPELDISGIVE